MTKCLKYVGGSALVASTVLGLYSWFFWSPAGAVVKGKSYEGVVVDPTFSRPSSGPWRPRAEDIRQLEAALPHYVKSPAILGALSSYRRTYRGLTNKENKEQIIVVKFHAPSLLSRRQWLNGTVINGGAREDNWTVIYYPGSNVFTSPIYFEYVTEPH